MINPSDSAIDTALAALIDSYTTSLHGIFGGETISGGGGGDNPGGGGDEPGGTTINADVECTFTGGEPSSNLFNVNGNYTTSYGSVVINGVTLNTALKMESTTSVNFTTDKEMTLTLIFSKSVKGDFSIKVDGATYNGSDDPSGVSGQGILTMTLEAGAHVLTKANTAYLFYIGLKEIQN